MKQVRKAVWRGMLILGLLLAAGSVLAQEDERSLLTRPTNLLQNPGFDEAALRLGHDAIVAGAWTPFKGNLRGADAVVDGNLTYEVRPVADEASGWPDALPSGVTASTNRAQTWTSEQSTFAGVYQVVEVGEGAAVLLSARTRARSFDAESEEAQGSVWIRQRIGIDPTGETDPMSDSVVWTVPANFLEKWGALSVQAQADSDRVTVFLSAYPHNSLAQHEVFYDTVSLIAVAQPLPAVRQVAVAAEPVINYQPPACSEALLEGMVQGCGVVAGQQGYAAVRFPAVGEFNDDEAQGSSGQLPILGSMIMLLVTAGSVLRLIQFKKETYE